MGTRSRRSLGERFWPKVDRTDGCWEWQAATTNNGYGRLGAQYAHRVAWEMGHGPIPRALMVCHHCDNRRCVRLSHLFLGDASANQADMVSKGRSLRGERHNRVALKEGDVREIRAAWDYGGHTQAQLAARFNTTKGNISQIVRGKKWQHLLPADWTPPAPRRWSRAGRERGGGDD